MDRKLVDRIVNAVLYEGYILYPYRASSVKNRHRFNFGVLYPKSASGAGEYQMQTETLVSTNNRASLEVTVRFLHMLSREVGRLPVASDELEEGAEFEKVAALEVEGRLLQSWQEAVERSVVTEQLDINSLATQPLRQSFNFDSMQTIEALRDRSGQAVGVIAKKQERIEGEIEIAAEAIAEGLFKVTARISNLTPVEGAQLEDRDDALMRSLVSTHTILNVNKGEFVSLLDPPPSLREAAVACQNKGTWPVLVGAQDQRDTVLSSPIILYDYPQVAPESPGDLFDATEIDEILTLRILTLTDEEKSEMRQVDERARQILERAEALEAEHMIKLHGAVRELRPIAKDE